ncbi:MAG: Sec-independent protein translocase protein TatB [Kiloniellaceae bacterium]
MFDIGWSEMAVIALIALIVIGPKDLPRAMKTAAQWMRKARSLTREFQSGIDDIVREAELEDARKALDATRGGNLRRTISNAIDPDDELASEVRDVEREARREGDAAKPAPAGEGKDSNADRVAAKMVTQPASVAPAHSLPKPAEAPVAAGGTADEKPASEDSKQSA